MFLLAALGHIARDPLNLHGCAVMLNQAVLTSSTLRSPLRVTTWNSAVTSWRFFAHLPLDQLVHQRALRVGDEIGHTHRRRSSAL